MRLVLTCLALLAVVPAAHAEPKSAATTHGCTWTTVDDFAPAGALKSAAGSVIVTSSTVLVGGVVFSDPLTSSWVVRKSKNGSTWTTVDNFTAGASISTHPNDIAKTTSSFVVVGGANNGSRTGPWLVRTSLNATTWNTVDSFDDPALPAATANAVVVDTAGHILAGGFNAVAADHSYHWVVRESADNGTTWTISDDDPPIANSAGVQGMGVDPLTGDVYAAGFNFDGSQYEWQVRRREAGTWTTVDQFLQSSTPASTVGSAAGGVAASGVGTIFVAGGGRDAANGVHWVVRKSVDHGLTWSTVDDIGGGTQICGASTTTFDQSNKILYVVGRCRTGSGNYHWIVRASSDEGSTWTTDDDFVDVTGHDSMANALDTAADNTTIAVGTSRDANDVPHWIARQRTCR